MFSDTNILTKRLYYKFYCECFVKSFYVRDLVQILVAYVIRLPNNILMHRRPKFCCVIRILAKQHFNASGTQVALCHTQKKGMSFRTPQFLTTTKLLISQINLITSTIVVDTLEQFNVLFSRSTLH